MGKKLARMEEDTSASKILTGKRTTKRPLRSPRRRSKNNSIIYLKELDINTRNWIDSLQDRHFWRVLVNLALKFGVS